MSVDFSHVTFISAGAGSGKTYRLIQDLERALVEGGTDPARVVATTFTVKAAGELKERVRARLIASGRLQLAEQMAQALIGTVHSVCERLLKRFAFELGISPELNVMSVEDGSRFFKQALDDVLDLPRVREMNATAALLGQDDWQGEAKRIAEKARENDLSADALIAMAKESADALLAFFGNPQPGDHKGALIAAVEHALATIDLDHDTTKGTREYLVMLRESLYRLKRQHCPWSTRIVLSAAEAKKKSDHIAAEVREIASRYEVDPEFHAHVRTYTEGVMTIASAALDRFQALKTERGLIDFLDMEQLMLHALDEPAVTARLKDELDLLLVDEFQDTNPMQLALFVKLAPLANQVIFVGDVKQAIYAFRGCDSDLVFNTLEGMTGKDAKTDKLPYSWRSRPDLVHYVNATFATAFSQDGLEADRVTLEYKRAEVTQEPAVMRWSLDGGNKGVRAPNLAQGIADLVHSGYTIVDPDTEQVRPVRWGDIAVLARTNDNVELIARTLKDQRVPMKMTLSGLLATPEVCLARACLRRLNDGSDTLATAEIMSLADCAEPETWLTDRLTWLTDEANQGQRARWGEDAHAIVARLAHLRADSALRSPLEIVARVLNDVGTRHIATHWGPDAIKATQRQRNLDAFLNLAVNYEQHCASQHLAATLTGFLFWLENPSSPELDLQPMVTSGDAVHVSTYHRAKGLEWPVVIATDFDKGDRTTLWDTRVDLTADFDVAQPLANRTIRFWPNVFGGRSKNLPALDRILNSDEGRQCAEKSASELRRLAYVGITRARDLLAIALPASSRGDGWLEHFGSGDTLPTGDELALSSGHTIATRATSYDGTAPQGAIEKFVPRWYMQRERRSDFLKEIVTPSMAAPVEGVTMGEVVELGDRIPVHGKDMTTIGSALHAVIAAEIVNPGQTDAVERAGEILQAYQVDGFLKAEDAVEAGRRLRERLQQENAGATLIAECPMTHALDDGRVVRGFIDLLLEHDGAMTLIDHKSSPQPKSSWVTEVAAHSGQLTSYALGLGGARCRLHFPISGGLVDVDLGR